MNFYKAISIKKYTNLNRVCTIIDKTMKINTIHSFYKIKEVQQRKILNNTKTILSSETKSKNIKKIAREISTFSHHIKRRPSRSLESSYDKSLSLTNSINHPPAKKRTKHMSLTISRSYNQRVDTLNDSQNLGKDIFNRLYQVNYWLT